MQKDDFDYLCCHLVETTASAGLKFQPSAWAATVQYVIAHRNLARKNGIRLRTMQSILKRLKEQK